MSFKNTGQSLRTHWLLHNIEINDGVSEESLRSFESKYSVVIPTDLRDYFLSVNGMPAGTTDEALIRFWMLEEVKPLPEGAPDYSQPLYTDGPGSLFLFADYSLWAHAYAIRLTAQPVTSNEVFVIGGNIPIPLFNSFSEFVDSYLTNKDLFLSMSNDLSARITKMIEDFASETDQDPLNLRQFAIRERVLPLLVDMGGVFAINTSGDIISFPFGTDDNGGIVAFPLDKDEHPRLESDLRIRNIALYQGSKKYPQLKYLIVKPDNARVCPSCGGTGINSYAEKLNTNAVICYCGGLGWIP